jgi:hypothetical protein
LSLATLVIVFVVGCAREHTRQVFHELRFIKEIGGMRQQRIHGARRFVVVELIFRIGQALGHVHVLSVPIEK